MSLKKTSGTPTSVNYADPSNLNTTVKVRARIQPVNKRDGKYNHVRQEIRVGFETKPPRACEQSCATSPVVLTLVWSAPEGVQADVPKAVLDKVLEHIALGTAFLAGPDTLDVDTTLTTN